MSASLVEVDDAVLLVDGFDLHVEGWATSLAPPWTPPNPSLLNHRAGCGFAEYEVPPEICSCNRSLDDLDV